MLKEFFALNQKKFIKLPLIFWIILLVCIFIASQLFPGGGEKVSLQTGFQIALIYATSIMAIVVIVSIIAGVYKFYKKRTVFNRENWLEFFTKNNFKTTLINEHTKMLFTEEVKSGKLNGFDVIADIPKEPNGMVQFQFYVSSEPIDKEEYTILEKQFKHYQGGFDMGYIFKNVNKNLFLFEIEQSLAEFVSILKAEKFFPANLR